MAGCGSRFRQSVEDSNRGINKRNPKEIKRGIIRERKVWLKCVFGSNFTGSDSIGLERDWNGDWKG